jgi:starch-binding outer membrane protein, SusD/RagB family
MKMKRNILTFIVGTSMFIAFSACTNLEVESNSVVNSEFVFSEPTTARAALLNAYNYWRDSYIHSNGLFYLFNVDGSDIERYPVSYTAATQFLATNLYGTGTSAFPASQSDCKTAWDNAYKIIAVCNSLCTAFESTKEFKSYMTSGSPSELSQIYGESIALRATIYFELLRYYGDVPHTLTAGKTADGLTPRDQIYDYHIQKLIDVEPYMYRCGENASVPNTYMTRTYVQGLIGRMCLYAGGYQTRRTDLSSDFYKNANGTLYSYDKVNESSTTKSFYGRRTDYKTFYQTAYKYLLACVNAPGTAALCVTDPRTTSGTRAYNNPYQYVFQQMNDLTIPTEDVYEIPENYSLYSERPYAFGRPSNGGSKNGYPCKDAGQSRFHPYYYYGDFSKDDKRRDVTCTVTGSTGKGIEIIIPWAMGNKCSGGGISNNKWDENRMATVYTAGQRASGINNPYMRFSDIMLMLAEVSNEEGDATTALSMLTQVRARAFGSSDKANVSGFISDCGSMLDAILEERKLEFGGEGMRRYDLIRTGKIYTANTLFHNRATAMINGLKTNGYYQFSNGNVISNYIWTKLVDAKTTYTYRLTASGVEGDPVLYPGWRGQNDDWTTYGLSYGTTTPKTNLAIKGLFEYIDPNGSVAANLENNEGYTRVNWGIDIVNNYQEYNDYIFCGLKNNEPPIYLLPINPVQIANSNGTITNGYGFLNE